MLTIRAFSFLVCTMEAVTLLDCRNAIGNGDRFSFLERYSSRFNTHILTRELQVYSGSNFQRDKQWTVISRFCYLKCLGVYRKLP